ncbi:sensor domain-containing diguanylate cyclase [Candidatus Endoriftia persephone]|uniref:diguanylate cyclase n=1 Tax=Candidatus Endoriftia persephonae TaxID=393765 RepID=A0A9J6ZZQ2_9GAMM|nr:sensor domain-containing diguanylate cyclase [Candidatus Endoriftia persephone]USF88167.1 diguanylate cyclase [Candidatus Endoriftia persephone]
MDFSFSQVSMDLRERFFNLLDSLSALRALSRIDMARLTEEELVEQALEQLVRYQNLESCSVFFLEQGELRCVAGTSMSEIHTRRAGIQMHVSRGSSQMHFGLGEGIIGIAAQTGDLQYCNDCQQSPAYKPFPDEEVGRPGSLVCVPIKMGDRTLGVLNASHPMNDYFEPWQQHTISLFCSMLGQMLHNHRLLHDLEYVVDQRTVELRAALREAEQLRQRYERLAAIDGLTGLHNRRFFFDEAGRMLAQVLRHDFACSLLLLDVDYFKRVNEEWGFAVGDRLLCRIAEILKAEARGGDLVARIGGEEFVVLMPDSQLEGAHLLAQRIQERFALIDLGVEIGRPNLSLSVGVSMLDRQKSRLRSPAELVEQLYTEANQALYQCKSEGCNYKAYSL